MARATPGRRRTAAPRSRRVGRAALVAAALAGALGAATSQGSSPAGAWVPGIRRFFSPLASRFQVGDTPSSPAFPTGTQGAFADGQARPYDITAQQGEVYEGASPMPPKRAEVPGPAPIPTPAGEPAWEIAEHFVDEFSEQFVDAFSDIDDLPPAESSAAAAAVKPGANASHAGEALAAAALTLAGGMALPEILGSVSSALVGEELLAGLLNGVAMAAPQSAPILLASALSFAAVVAGADAFKVGHNVTSQQPLVEVFEDIRQFVVEQSKKKVKDQIADLEDEPIGSLLAGAQKEAEKGQPVLERHHLHRDHHGEHVEPHMAISMSNGVARREDGAWRVPLQAHLFWTNEGRHGTLLRLARKVLFQGWLGIDESDFNDEKTQATYEERARLIFRVLQPPLASDRSNQLLEYRIIGPVRDGQDSSGPWHELPPTDAFGSVVADVELPDEDLSLMDKLRGSATLELRLATAQGQREVRERVTVKLVEPEGLTVISDIDDTIKVTEVFRGKEAMLRRTFMEDFKPVLGMAGLYRKLAGEYGADVQYVSKSPPELHEPLRDFLEDSRFPVSAIHLCSLFRPNRGQFKQQQVEKIIEQFPNRRFILVGDSGENDAGIYADVLKKYPKQVKKILIREVHPSKPVDTETAFEGVEDSKWQVFRDASQVVLPPLKSKLPQFPWLPSVQAPRQGGGTPPEAAVA